MTELELILTGQTEQHIHWLNEKIGIHHNMVDAYTRMQRSAKLDGVDIKIASGFRSFSRQLLIWQNKYQGKTTVKDAQGHSIELSALSAEAKIHAIMLFSALPGASRHHWGCDIDVYASNLLAPEQSLQLEPWEYSSTGPLYNLTLWLAEHANAFGFYFPYDVFRGGVAAEPWHLSYQPIAKQYQQTHNEALLEKVILNSDIDNKALLIELLPELYQRYISNIALDNN